MFKLSDERRYQVERAKDNTPSTNAFVWFVPVFFLLAWICRQDLPMESHHASMPETHLVILGWELL